MEDQGGAKTKIIGFLPIEKVQTLPELCRRLGDEIDQAAW
jgi:hypothetical protein